MITETVWANTPADLDDAIQTAARAHHNIMPAQIHLTSHVKTVTRPVEGRGLATVTVETDVLVALLVWERD